MRKLMLLPVVIGMLVCPVMAEPVVTPVEISIFDPVSLPHGEYYSVRGFRLTVIHSLAEEFCGLDLGVVPHVNGKFIGAQVGIAPLTRGNLYGYQDGCVSMVRGNFRGLQCGGFFGRIDGYGIGAQYAFVNKAGEFHGLQLGIVNIAEHLVGVQIGLLNFNAQGRIPFFPIVNVGF